MNFQKSSKNSNYSDRLEQKRVSPLQKKGSIGFVRPINPFLIIRKLFFLEASCISGVRISLRQGGLTSPCKLVSTGGRTSVAGNTAQLLDDFIYRKTFHKLGNSLEITVAAAGKETFFKILSSISKSILVEQVPEVL